MPVDSDAELLEILGLRTVAVVGCSTTPGKAAHDVPAYLVDRGYDVIPVNPNAEEVLGRTAYDSLSDVPEGVELVDVFRPSEEVPGIVDAALERDDVRALWLQLDVTHPEAVRRAEAGGLAVVQDKCIEVEHRRLVGG